MPTLDEVVDNLGEPMCFEEYRVDGDDAGESEQDGARDKWTVADIEQNMSSYTNVEEVGTSGSGSGSATDIVDVAGAMHEEVRLMRCSFMVCHLADYYEL